MECKETGQNVADTRKNATHGELVTLREYVDMRVESIMREVGLARDETKTALAAADKAVLKSETASEKRFEAVNEFRAALNDSTSKMVLRTEVEAALKGVNDQLDKQVTTCHLLMPRTEVEAMLREHKEKIDANTARLNTRELMPRIESEARHNDAKERIDAVILRLNTRDDRGHGRSDVWQWIVLVIGALLSVLGIVSFFNAEGLGK